MKKLYITILSLILIFTITPNSQAQKVSSWARPSLENIENKKIMPIILRNKDLRQSITRGEYTHLLMRYLLSNKDYDLDKAAVNFKDVQEDKVINMAYNIGIITGYTDGTFKPNVFLTRSEAAVIANNVENILGNKRNGSVKGFKDSRFIPTWAQSSIGAMVEIGVMSGYSDGNFIPSRHISRQEAIVMVDKLSKEKESKFVSLYEISKDDKYLKKEEYDYILNNLPSEKYSLKNIKQYIFDTDKKRRQKIYSFFVKNPPSFKNKMLSSPNLIFDVDKSTYMLGMETRTTFEGKKEKRIFMTYVSTDGDNVNIEFPKDVTSWIIE